MAGDGVTPESDSPDARQDGGVAAAAAVLENAGDGTPPPSDLELAKLPKNDVGNGARFRRRCGDDFLVVTELHRDHKDGWFQFAGTHWEPSRAYAAAQREAHGVAAAIHDEAEALEAEGPAEGEAEKDFAARVDKLHRHAVTSGNSARIGAMLSCASPYLQVSRAELDADPDLLALPNGTLDLTIAPAPGALRPSRRADRITRVAGAPYVEGAECPRFRQFLARILPDPEVRGFVQRYLGYALTGHVGEQLVLLFYGHGANGKSTLLNILRGILGGYYTSLDFSSLTTDPGKRGSDATPDLVKLVGARLMSAAEPEVGTTLSESVVKQHTGGEPVPVRPLFGNFFEFHPTHKAILSFNHFPNVKSQDDGTWRRLAMVHFGARIPPEERDPRIVERILREEASGVLNWLLDGLALWREDGLQVPEAVRQATQNYREDKDPLAKFLADCTRPPEAGESRKVAAKHLYTVYQGWARANNVDPVDRYRFGRLMRERPDVEADVRLAKGVRGYGGLLVREDVPEEWLSGAGEPPPGGFG